MISSLFFLLPKITRVDLSGFALTSFLLLSVSSLTGEDSENGITLAESTAKAIQSHPSLKPYDAERRGSDARIISALTAPNPELEVEVEDVLGDGVYERFGSAVYNVGISQLLELGGKRLLRGEVAEREREVEILRYEVAKREVIRETAVRFVAVQGAQMAEANAVRNLEISRENLTVVTKLSEGGRGSKVDVGQSEIGAKEAKIQLDTAQRMTAMARQRLASMWGDVKPRFDSVAGSLSRPPATVPELDSLEEGLAYHPLVAMAEAAVRVASQRLTLEEKKKTPDMNVGVGYRRDSSIDDNAVVLGFSLPLPLRNRNEGGIAEAQAGIALEEAKGEQVRSELRMTLGEEWARLVGAHSTYQLISNDMIPAAREQYKAVNESFQLSRMSYLELLEARRSLTAAQKQGIDALREYYEARIAIEVLTGREF
ncbi:MAG: TolC family protein [Verrucomicrobiales bacterium]|jgi:cobalt-zinc-cadmium efflux system outer membrane protein|nr:TolC family protein [Verrucomicrobiales bacterium]MBP9223310.1 TolC family protein [Verrucomicrobiales bacterium]